MPRVLLINGSPHANGCIGAAFGEMVRVFIEEGVDTEIVHVGNRDIRGCISCGRCRELGKCVFDDAVNETAPKFEAADGLYSTRFPKHFKVGAAVVSCRRGGNTASFDVLNKYFTISSMPVASSTYWNQVHGFTAEDVKKDLEGLQVMRNLARNMSFMIKAIADAGEKYGLPVLERGAFTSFPDGL